MLNSGGKLFNAFRADAVGEFGFGMVLEAAFPADSNSFLTQNLIESFKCLGPEGGPPCPPKLVGTVADPRIVQARVSFSI